MIGVGVDVVSVALRQVGSSEPLAPTIVAVTIPESIDFGNTPTATVTWTGYPRSYNATWEWYIDDVLVDGQTTATFTAVGLLEAGVEIRARLVELDNGVAPAAGPEDSNTVVVAGGSVAPDAPTIASVEWISTGTEGEAYRAFTLSATPAAGLTVLWNGNLATTTLSPTVSLGGNKYREAAPSGGFFTNIRAALRDDETLLVSDFSDHVTLTAAKAPVAPPAPTLVGGEEQVTLTINATTNTETFPTTSYDYRISTDNTFATVDRSGTVLAANIGTPVVVGALDAGDYYAQSRARSAWGADEWSVASSAATVTAATPPAAGLVSAAGAVEAEAALDETATAITWTLDSVELGTATLADLALGPVCVRLPTTDPASPTTGQTVTATGGLWAYLAAHGIPSVSRAWYSAGEPVPGETGLTTTVTASQETEGLAYRETATDAAGSRTATVDVIATPFPLPILFGTSPGAPVLYQGTGTAGALAFDVANPPRALVLATSVRIDSVSASSRHISSVTGDFLFYMREANDAITLECNGMYSAADPDVMDKSSGAFMSLIRTNNTAVPEADRRTLVAGSTISLMVVLNLDGLNEDPTKHIGLWWGVPGTAPAFFSAAGNASYLGPDYFFRPDYLPIGGARAQPGGSVTTPFAASEIFHWYWATTQWSGQWQFSDPEAAHYAPALFFDQTGNAHKPRDIAAAQSTGIVDGVEPGLFISGPPSQWASGTNRAPNGTALVVNNSSALQIGSITAWPA